VRTGAFARDWLADGRSGHRVLKKRLAEESDRAIERVGRRLRRVAHGEDSP
jgi:ketol-acid reductoisomerase